MKKLIFAFILSVFCPIVLYSQESVSILKVEEVLALVRRYHPVVQQSVIYIKKSEAETSAAKGNFDPTISVYSAEKTLDGVNYYKNLNTELNIPLWYGFDISAGTDHLVGNRLNPSQTKGNSNYLGLTIPLAKNLFMDKRRASLQQAEIFESISKVAQTAVVNDILLQAVESYYQWAKAYQIYKVAQELLESNNKRLRIIEKSYEFGEKAEIDVVEAKAQLQSFQILQNQSFLEYQNAQLELSTFLWTENNRPYFLPEFVTPQTQTLEEVQQIDFGINLDDLLKTAALNHPNLILYGKKLEVLEVDKKLKFQDLLPKIDFSYNFLNKGNPSVETFQDQAFFTNNFQFGLKVEFPLFFRQGRANYKMAKLKIQDAEILQAQKAQEIEVKVKSLYNTYTTGKAQLFVQNEAFTNYAKLLKAEEMRFQNGESSLFLINSRENKVFELQQKLIDYKIKYLISIYKLQWSAGQLK